MIFDKLRRKKEDLSLPPTVEAPVELPEDLERFRVKQQEVNVPEIRNEPREEYAPEMSYGKSVEELVAEKTEGNKIELILQKLETIDARLRLIEEKIKRY